MKKVEKVIVIDASVEETFAYVSDTPNLVEIWPSMTEVKDIEVLPHGGKRFLFVYKMAGIPLEGISEDEEWVANQRIVGKTKGGIESKITWQFQPEGDGTRLALTAEYSVPIPLIGRVAEAILVLINDQELEVMLTYLKARVEWVSKSTRRRSGEGMA